jgi:hypothetical protein
VTDRLHIAAARFVLGETLPDDLPRVAIDAIGDGCESESLAALAGASSVRDSPYDLRELWRMVLGELGIAEPSVREAAAVVVAVTLQEYANGACSAESAMNAIIGAWQVGGDYASETVLGDSFGIEEIVGAWADDYDADGGRERRIEEALENTIRGRSTGQTTNR